MVSPLLFLLVLVLVFSEVLFLVKASPSPFLFLTPFVVLVSPEYVVEDTAPDSGSLVGTIRLGVLSLPFVEEPTEPFFLEP